MQRDMICILCPVGCMLTVKQDADGQIAVSGNSCKRGIKYGETELTNPMRMVTSTVRVNGGREALCSVKTAEQVPKGRVSDVLKSLKNVCVSAPLNIGDVVLSNAAGTGVDVIATRNVHMADEMAG